MSGDLVQNLKRAGEQVLGARGLTGNDHVRLSALLKVAALEVEALRAAEGAARDDAAELRAAAADAAALLKRIDHWEGSVILADEVWATSDGMPKLTRELYDQWIELQDERNRVRAALAATEGEA